ncbi:hypothetical protein EVG20_g9937 [Dentipellis fragilis]|uniref:Autophagy-related protein 101 n=1 Tax=Dentipellis fragilis TaxID=205917 RepID=A0A4Y9XVR6_9AGAM|nr:hypothetical protein EVG20_g9937 [Dentipellis fragilis]
MWIYWRKTHIRLSAVRVLSTSTLESEDKNGRHLSRGTRNGVVARTMGTYDGEEPPGVLLEKVISPYKLTSTLVLAMNTTHAIITIDIILDRHNTRDVLRALLHAILFHRLFGSIKPQTFEVLDITLPGVADPEMEALVDEKVEMFWKGMENGANKRGQISVTFSGKQQKKSWIGLSYEARRLALTREPLS